MPLSPDRPLGTLPLHVWADEIRAIANEELFWGTANGIANEYTRRRCDRLIRLAAEMAAVADARDADTIEALYRGDLTHLTPYSGGEAAIFDEAGRILLIQRTDNRLWAMPGGAFEVGEFPELSPGHGVRLADAFRRLDGTLPEAVFDPFS